MVTSLGGLNERWAQIGALQPPQAVQGRDKGLGFGNGGTVTTDLPPVSPIAGSTASPLSSDTNFLLTMFSGGTGLTSQAKTGSPTFGQGPTGAAVLLQPDALSNPLVPIVDGGADGITGSTMVQQLQMLVSGGGQRGFIAGSGSSPSAGPQGGGDAIGNSGTAAPSWHNGWDSTVGPSDRGRQQVGLAAYASGDFASQDSTTTRSAANETLV